MSFGMLFEDPFYDEDGVLIDEDADIDTDADPGDLVYNEALGEWVDSDSYDPFETVNS